MSGPFADSLFADPLFGGSAEDEDALSAFGPDLYWRIELYDSGGDLLSFLPAAFNIQRSVRVSQPATISFSLPLLHEDASLIGGDKLVYLRNTSQNVWQIHRIMRVRKTIDANGAFMHVEGESLLGFLAEQIVVDYRAENRSVANILGDLMALQTWTTKIDLGRIDPYFSSQTATVSWQKVSILQCINDLVRQFGGFVRCGAVRMSWLTNVEHEPDGRRIEVGKDVLDLEIEDDYSDVCTRLYAYGAGGADGAEINLQRHGGQAQQYIDADNIDATSPRARIVTNSNIGDGATLLAYAQMMLARKKNHATRYRTSAIDLALGQVGQYDYQRFVVGSKLHVSCSPLNIQFVAAIAEISQQMDNPASVRIVLADPNDLNRESVFNQPRLSQTLAPLTEFDFFDGTSGEDGSVSYVADDVDDLPNTSIPENALARVTDGDYATTYQRNATNTGWEPLSQWLPYTGS